MTENSPQETVAEGHIARIRLDWIQQGEQSMTLNAATAEVLPGILRQVAAVFDLLHQELTGEPLQVQVVIPDSTISAGGADPAALRPAVLREPGG